MHFEPAFALRAPVSKDLVRPPAFRITAAPDAHLLHVRQFQSAIHPASAAPSRRANIPIWMIIERDYDNLLREAPKPERAQMVKIARAVQNKWRELRFHLPIKLLHHPRRRREAQKGSPFSGVNRFKGNRLRGPGIVQVEVKSAIGVMHGKSLDARNF